MIPELFPLGTITTDTWLVFANAVFFHGAWLLVPPVTRQVGPAALWVGTSGHSYPEWVEAGIYPTGTKAGEMLLLYAREFPVTELNDTWYQMPRAEESTIFTVALL